LKKLKLLRNRALYQHGRYYEGIMDGKMITYWERSPAVGLHYTIEHVTKKGIYYAALRPNLK